MPHEYAHIYVGLLKDTDFKTSKSVASKIIKEHKEIGGD